MFYYWANLPKYVPFDGQICWVRTVASFFFPFLAAWDAASESFISVVTGLTYSKEVVSRWKEYANSPGKVITFLSDNNPLNTLRIDLNGLKYFYYSISWGDGTYSRGYFTGTIIIFNKTYSVAGDYTVTITTPSASITYLRINNEPVSGNLPNLTDYNYLTFLQLSQVNIAGAMYTSLPWPLLTDIIVRQSLITGTFPPVNTTPLLQTITCRNTALAGALPAFNLLPELIRIEMDTCGFTGTIPDFSGCTKMQVIRLAANALSGSFPSLLLMPSLNNVYCTSCGLSGAVPSFANNPLLTSVQFDNNDFTSWTSHVVPLALTTMLLQTNNMPVLEVNKVLADFAFNIASRPAVGTLNLSGVGMAAPTGQGLIDKAAIIARGWTCTTN